MEITRGEIMAFTKITNTELNARGATTLPNQPTISATALKQEFDAPAKNVVAPKFNNLIDELESTTASASLGAVAPSGHTGSTVQAVINSIASEVGTLEGQIPVIEAQAHSHPNKDLLDTYTQTNADITQAIADDHTHANKDLLDTYSNTDADITTAIASTHSHSNKNLLDTYNQSNADIEDAIAKKHTHSNKALLDTYTQTESDLSDAVSKKHTHSNKTVIDKFGEDSSGNPTYDGNPIGGGGTGNVNDAYKTVKVGLTSLVASGEDTLILKGGSNVTLVADNLEKSITINSTGGGGQSTGDMLAADYDSDFDVKNAGGIKAFVNSAATYTGESGVVVSNKKIKADLANYTSSPLASANISTVQNRQYAVGLDANDHLSVNVPWEDTTYNDATTSASGLMSATDKTKLNSLDTVVANPAGSSTADLTKLQIGNTIYAIKGGGGTTIVQIPSVSGTSFVYDGTAQGAAITGLDTTHCTVVPGTGTTVTTVGSTTYVKATNAGNYDFTIELNDPSSMVWSDLTVADKTYAFAIAKASQTITASKNSVSLTAQQPSDTVTISGQQTSLNVSSSATGVATVSESSGVVTITAAGNGSATVSVYAEETANYAQSATVSISVTSAIVPDGKTVTPTDGIQTWLHCANIWDKTYTTINQVLADSTTLLALISSNNAADYMKRSTTWVSAVTANSTAMSYIGANDYCANELLDDSTWRTAICNSTYFESVLNTKMPTMTSDNTPSGYAVSASPGYSGFEAYKAFDNVGNNFAVLLFSDSSPTVANSIQCKFVNPVCANKLSYATHWDSTYGAGTPVTVKVQGSNNGTSWTDLYEANNVQHGNDNVRNIVFENATKYEYYRLWFSGGTNYNGNYFTYMDSVQVYGRE